MSNLLTPSAVPKSLASLVFDNRFVRELPADPEPENHRRQVLGACYSRVVPTPVRQPQLVCVASEVAALLDLAPEDCLSETFTQVFVGNQLLAGMEPFASCYGGHQFGQWAGQLGDGRAINLGEVINQHGQRLTLQLKGAGQTPYSRRADGLAVLRSSVREFLCSEAMFHLGVPTTRALSLILTGEPVERDMFYDGNPQYEPGAVVCRVAPSFTRFGHFQLLTARNDLALLKQLVDFTIRTDFPHLGAPSTATYLEWLREICRSTAEMIVHWQRVGFVHGVMNTDNMSILGLTIDYGPYGWLENYDPKWTPNTTDGDMRRYCYGKQPQIAYWNVVQLANALFPLINAIKPVQAVVQEFHQYYLIGWQNMMANKLGLERFNGEADAALVNELLEILTLVETDMTWFYRLLATLDLSQDFNELTPIITALMPCYYVPEQLSQKYCLRLQTWMQLYQQRVQTAGITEQARCALMNRTNPKYVLRNYLAQQAIDRAEAGDFSEIATLLDVLRKPYAEQPEYAVYAAKRPDWAREKPGCSMLSCSS